MNNTAIAVDVRMINHSGIGTYTRNILARLINIRPDCNFILLGDPDGLRQFDWTNSPNVSVISFRCPIYSVAEQFWWIGKRIPAETLWVPHYNVPVLWRGRLFVTIHDVAHLALPEFNKHLSRRIYATGLLRHVRRSAREIAFDSRFTSEEFTRLVGRPAGRSSIIHLGVDGDWFSTPSVKKFEKPYVIFLGNIKPNKNLRRLLVAFNNLLDRIPHDLVLVGQQDGFLSGDADAIEAATSLGQRVRFTGRIADSEVRAYVAGADLLVMPSLYEGFGLPVLEAMACGCPVLAARASSLPEVGGDAVAYCDPLDVSDIALQIQILLEDKPLRTTMSERGRLRARSFDWDMVAATMASALCLNQPAVDNLSRSGLERA